MPSSPDQFTLSPHRWYAWQMLPGYVKGRAFQPYISPIYVEALTPLKTGRGLLNLAFFNAAYAPGVQFFELKLRTLMRAPAFMIAEILSDEQWAAIITQADFGWLQHHFRIWWQEQPPGNMSEPCLSDVQAYLSLRLLHTPEPSMPR
jgi:hypothetical protein